MEALNKQQSRWRTGGFTVRATEHGFCNGAQHEQRDRYRPSSFDTDVVFMQNPEAAARWQATPELEQELRAAFSEALPADMPTYREWEARGTGSWGRPTGSSM